MEPDSLRSLVAAACALVVSAGWLTSLVVGAAQHDWTPLTITTPVMLLLAGYAFGIKITRGPKDE